MNVIEIMKILAKRIEKKIFFPKFGKKIDQRKKRWETFWAHFHKIFCPV